MTRLFRLVLINLAIGLWLLEPHPLTRPALVVIVAFGVLFWLLCCFPMFGWALLMFGWALFWFIQGLTR